MVEPVVGLVEDTFRYFFRETFNLTHLNFFHMDMDTYKPTKYVLEKIKPYLVKDAIILFDEFFNYVGWKSGEFKAFIEVFDSKEISISGVYYFRI